MPVPFAADPGVGFGTVTSAAAFAVPYPVTVFEDDLLIAHIFIRNITDTPSTPAGWTLQYGPDTLGTSARHWTYYKFADGTETGTESFGTTATTSARVGRMYRVRGVETSGDPFDDAVAVAGFGGIVSDQAVTTTVGSRLAVNLISICANRTIGPMVGSVGGDWAEPFPEYLFIGGGNGTVTDMQTAAMPVPGTINGGSYSIGGATQWGIRGFSLLGAATSPAEFELLGVVPLETDWPGPEPGRLGSMLLTVDWCGPESGTLGEQTRASSYPALATAEALVGVYQGPASTAGVTSFETFLGREVDIVLDYFDASSWSTIENPSFFLGAWDTFGRTMQFGVPIFPDGAPDFDAAVAGDYDAHFTTLANNINASGLTDSILRLGWEFGLGFFTWTPQNGSEALKFGAYFDRIVDAMRAVVPTLRFEWCPIWGFQHNGVDPTLAYPSDENVDFIGVDIYDQSWIPNYTDPEARWNDMLTTLNYSLTFWRDFAVEKNKQFAFPEWGVAIRSDGHGGGDEPSFITNVADLTRDPTWNVAYHTYFSVDDGSVNYDLQSGDFPLSAAEYVNQFG